MGVVLAGNKISILGVIRIQGRLQCCDTWIGNGAYWQPFYFIGIVWRRRGQVLSGQVAVKIFDAIYYGGVGFQAHLFFQPIMKYG